MEGFIRGSGVRLFQVVTKPSVVIFAANFKFGLYWPRLTDNLRDEIAILQFEWGLVLSKIFKGLRATRFQQRNLQPGLC